MTKFTTQIISLLLFVVSISPLIADDSSMWMLPEHATARFGKGKITDLSYSPDGKLLAVGSSIGVWLYDVNTGKELALLAGQTKTEIAQYQSRKNYYTYNISVAFTPDGKTLISSGWGGNIRMWDVDTRTHKMTVASKFGLVRHLSDGKKFVFSGKKIQLLPTNTDTDELSQTHDPYFFSSNIVSKDGTIHRTVSPDGMIHIRQNYKDRTLYLWDLKTGKYVTKLSGKPNRVRSLGSLAFSHDGSILAGGFDNAIRIWDSKTGKNKKTLILRKGSVWTLAFSPDGKMLASGSSDNNIRLWETETWKYKVILSGHDAHIRTLAFSPDGETLASESYDGTIRFWDTQTGKEKNKIIHNQLPSHVILSSDGKTLVNSEFGDVFLWDIDTAQLKNRINSDLVRIYLGGPYAIDLSGDGTTLSQFGRKGEDKRHFFWNLKTGEQREPFKGQFEDIIPSTVSKMLSPDGKRLVVGKNDGTIQFWNTYTGALERTHTKNKDWIHSMAYSQDGKLFAAGDGNQTIHVWDAVNAEHIATFTTSYGAINALAFSPDSSILASGTHKEIHLWNLETGESSPTFGHEGITSLAFSPDGKILASGSKDSTIRLWNTDTVSLINTLIGHSGSISSLTFRPTIKFQDDDIKTLVSLSDDATVLVWKIQPTADTDAVVKISPHLVESHIIGQQLTFNIDISKAKSITGYKVTVDFDTTALRYVSSRKGDYLPENATFTVQDVYPNRVKLESTSKTASEKESGSLASITYEVLDGKDSTVSLPSVILENGDGSLMRPIVKHATVSKTLEKLNTPIDPTQVELPKGAIARIGKGTINDIKLSPDNSLLAVASSIGIWLYDAFTGNELALLTDKKARTNTLAFSPNGELLISSSIYGTLQIWNLYTYKMEKTFKTESVSGADPVAFSPDGETFYYRKKILDLPTGLTKSELIWEDSHDVATVAFSPDGKTLVTANQQNKIRLWDIQTGIEKRVLHEGISYNSRGQILTFSPDGTSLAVSLLDHNGRNNKIYLWDMHTGELQRTYVDKRNSFVCLSMYFTSKGELITFSRHWHNRDIHIRNFHTGENLGVYSGHIGMISHATVSVDKSTLATASSHGTIFLWDIDTGQQLESITGHTNGINSIALCDETETLATSHYEQPVQLWDLSTYQHKDTLHVEEEYFFPAGVALSPDNTTLVAGVEKFLWLWDMKTHKRKQIKYEKHRFIQSILFSPNGQTLSVTSKWDRSFPLFDGKTGEQKLTLDGHAERIIALTFSPDGAKIATAETLDEGENVIRLWDAQTGKNINTIANVVSPRRGQRLPVNAVAFSPDGETLASVDAGFDVQLWDVDTGKHKNTFSSNSEDWHDQGAALVFSPDGKKLVSTVDYHRIAIWDVNTGKLKETLTGHTRSVNRLIYSADGTTLLSGGADGTVLLWKMRASPLPRLKITPLSLKSPPSGKTLKFNVNLIDAENVTGYEFTLKFDSDALEYIPSTEEDKFITTSQVLEKNAVELTGTASQDKTIENGTIATLTYEVIEPADITLTITDAILKHKDGKETRLVESHAWVIKPPIIPEDANRDWQVDAADLEFISSRLGQTGKGNTADINGDGIVDIADLVLVRKALYGTITEPNKD